MEEQFKSLSSQQINEQDLVQKMTKTCEAMINTKLELATANFQNQLDYLQASLVGQRNIFKGLTQGKHFLAVLVSPTYRALF